ncbi:MAG: hypothetical protein UT66_C0052G0012, partial [candidate division CPR2 bacterium GW2011_GWC1_39_9]
MVVVYAHEPIPKVINKSVFLAGPTPRWEFSSWRTEALRILESLCYN